MAVRFYEVAEWLFVSAMLCNALQRVTFPEFPELSRGRIGVKAAARARRFAVVEP